MLWDFSYFHVTIDTRRKMKTLKIFQTSDIHGNIFPTNYVQPREFGLAKISTLIKQQGQDADYKLIFDSGDLLQGSSLAFYNARFNNTEPSIIDGFNLIGYDGITLGNHEFNYGLDYLASHYTKFNQTILNANIEGLPFTTCPYQIYHVEDLKIAVIGLTTSFIPNWEQAANIPGLNFISPIDAYRKYEAQMQANADIIIVNYHGGFECDITDGITMTEPDSSENAGSKLIQTFDSIDIMLTGHQHRTISTITNGVVCLQPGCYGQQLAEVTIDIDSKKIINQQLISTTNITPDYQLTNLFAQQNAACNQYLDTTLCQLDRELIVTDIAAARQDGHPLLSLHGHAFTSYMEADFVALSLFDSTVGFNRDVTIRQVNLNYPFPNTILKIKLTGSQMIDAIKQAAAYYTLINGQIVINPSYLSPKQKHFNYDMYWGLDYTVKVTADSNIVTSVTVGGQPLEEDKFYTMLISNYRYNNREDFPVYNDVELLAESPIDAIDILIAYLSSSETINVEDDISYRFIK